MLRGQLAHRHVRMLSNQRDDLLRRAGLERPGAGRHLIEHDAQREQVTPIVDRAVLGELFGRPVVDRPGHAACRRHVARRVLIAVERREGPRQPEVQKSRARSPSGKCSPA